MIDLRIIPLQPDLSREQRKTWHKDKKGINFGGEKRRGKKEIQAVSASRREPGGGSRVHWAQIWGRGWMGAVWACKRGQILYCFKNTCRCCPTDTNCIGPQSSELFLPSPTSRSLLQLVLELLPLLSSEAPMHQPLTQLWHGGARGRAGHVAGC